MIAGTVNIPCVPYSKLFSIFWSAVVNGACFPRTFPNGRLYTGISENGGMTEELNIVVDRNGFILGRIVDTASKHDSKLALRLCQVTAYTWRTLRKILSDRGYRGEVIEHVKQDLQIELEVSNTPNGVKGFTPKPLRWVVERTFAWLENFHRLTMDYEASVESAEEMIDFATIKLLIAHV